MALKIINTSDGSHTLFNENLNETYHSIHGSIEESNHVYINAGLKNKIEVNNNLSVLEIGLGTGLNFLLLYKYLEGNNNQISYHTLEPYPIERSLLNKLNYPSLIGGESEEVFKLIHESEDEKNVRVNNKIIFRKSIKTIESIKLYSDSYDLVFFDAFAPSKQPEIWSNKNLTKIYKSMKDESILVTYSSSKKFKEILYDIGFKVEVLKGSKGKREMVRALK